MKVNDWVRTNTGIFSSILSVSVIHKTTYIECFNGVTYTQRDIKSSSSCIIDLIKKKDYVNGYRVVDIDLEDKKVFCYSDTGLLKEIPLRSIETIMGWEYFKEKCFKL